MRNQLGTGELDARTEASLLRRGIRFACAMKTPEGKTYLVTSKHASPLKKLAENFDGTRIEATPKRMASMRV